MPDRAPAGGGEARPLRALADAAGIAPSYVDMDGATQDATDETRARLLTAMGFDAASEAAAARSLEEFRAREAGRLVPPARVVVRGIQGDRPAADCATVTARVRGGGGLAVQYALELIEEGGARHRAEGEARVAEDDTLPLALPPTLGPGYHRVRVEARVPGRGIDRAGEQALVVAPPRCPAPAAVLGGRRVFGLTANLYTVRSARNWGAGDLTDLGELLAFARDVGAAFVGVNPLHALRNAGADVSPYSPVSRLFRNPLYVDVEAVPELADAPDARARLHDAETREAIARLRAGDRVDYDAVMRLKRAALTPLHAAFRQSAVAREAYHAYRAEQGRALDDFATFAALDEHFRARGAGWWREWPAAYQDRSSRAVAEFAAARESDVDFHRWTQFELDRQLGEVARRGRALGLLVGVYQDLAIGTSPAGSDAWSEPELFATGVSVGAPPDPLGPEGQNWGLPPLDPHRLAADGYRYWARLVRSAMRHAGALRIDHVIGLFRQFWIPEGMSGKDGAYVRFPADDLLGVLALEATRAGALVVGEDLGTVPPEVAPALARWGVMSSKVLYFEREGEGAFKPPRAYPAMALATANTHDLATLAGFWDGRDIATRRAVGQIRDDDEERKALEDRARDRAGLLTLLADEGLIDRDALCNGADGIDELTVRAAVHALLRRTPSWLVGISLDDLVGEPEAVNVPGVAPTDFPSWTRRLSTPLEALRADPAVRYVLGVEREYTPKPAGSALASGESP